MSFSVKVFENRFIGDIVVADIISRSNTSATGIVQFQTPSDAKRAMRMMHDFRFDGRPIDVRLDYATA